MKNFRFTRSLEGSPEGTVRAFNPAEVEPLIMSGALEETDEQPTVTESQPTSGVVVADKGSVVVNTKLKAR